MNLTAVAITLIICATLVIICRDANKGKKNDR